MRPKCPVESKKQRAMIPLSYTIHVIDQHDQSSNSSPLLELEVELKSRLAMA